MEETDNIIEYEWSKPFWSYIALLIEVIISLVILYFVFRNQQDELIYQGIFLLGLLLLYGSISNIIIRILFVPELIILGNDTITFVFKFIDKEIYPYQDIVSLKVDNRMKWYSVLTAKMSFKNKSKKIRLDPSESSKFDKLVEILRQKGLNIQIIQN